MLKINDGQAVELTPDEIAVFVAFRAPPPPTQDDYQRALEAHVEATARARNYSGAVSCVSYLSSTVPAWAAEARSFVAWRDAVYLAGFAKVAEVQQGAKAPSIAALLAALPDMEWSA